jgi:hypothetical protein
MFSGRVEARHSFLGNHRSFLQTWTSCLLSPRRKLSMIQSLHVYAAELILTNHG